MSDDFSKAKKPKSKSTKGKKRFDYSEMYYSDIMLDNMLFGVLVRSPIQCGAITQIDLPPLPDGAFFFSAKDIPGKNKIDIKGTEVPIFADENILYQGQPVGILVGPDETELFEILGQIDFKLQYTNLPIGLEFSDTFSAEQLLASRSILQGEVDKEYEQATFKFEQTFSLNLPSPPQEKNGALVYFSSRQLNIYSNTCWSSHLRKTVSSALNINENNIVLHKTLPAENKINNTWIASYSAAQAAVASFHTHKPVKLVYSIDEQKNYIEQNISSSVRHRTGVNQNGKIVSMDICVIINAGALNPFIQYILDRFVIVSLGIYNVENLRIDAYALKTNYAPLNCSFNWGDEQAFFAIENHIQQIANKLGVNHLEFRAKNIFDENNKEFFKISEDFERNLQKLLSKNKSENVENANANAGGFENILPNQAPNFENEQNNGLNLLNAPNATNFQIEQNASLASNFQLQNEKNWQNAQNGLNGGQNFQFSEGKIEKLSASPNLFGQIVKKISQKFQNKSPFIIPNKNKYLSLLIECVAQKSNYLRKNAAYQTVAQNPSNFDKIKRGIGIAFAFDGNGFFMPNFIRSKYSLELTLESEGLTIKTYSPSEQLKSIWNDIVCKMLDLKPEQIRFETDFSNADEPEEPDVLAENITIMTQLLKKCCKTIQNSRFRQALPITVKKTFSPPKKTAWNSEDFVGTPFLSTTWGVAVVEVEVDTITYNINVRNITIAIDGGEIMNQQQAEITAIVASNQIIKNFVSPQSLNIVQPNVYFIPSKEAPKQIGEIVNNILPAAFTNAVSQALNKPITSLPLSSDSIYSVISSSSPQNEEIIENTV